VSVLTIRLPDDKHDRLKALAEARKINVNKLIDELATIALANHDARLRFSMRAKRGSPGRALEVLNALDDA
jgi:predicted DNA-binding ribbon-helix-helix protein